MQGASILIVEDDQNLGILLKENLESKGFSVTVCPDGNNGGKIFNQQHFSLCLIDVMLPGKDGFTLAREIKHVNSAIPLIFLTSRSMELDKIKGFETGCDDYITKPFSIMELLLRINAVLKRSTGQEIKDKTELFRIGTYQFDSAERNLICPDNTEKRLSSKESELLKVFCERENELIHRQYLMNKVWGNDDFFISRSMDVFITRLRKLLKNDHNIEIQNVYGTGYRLMVKGQGKD